MLDQLENRARNYGLSRLSEESGISRPHIHKIISGRSSPSLRTIEKLLAILGCELTIKEGGSRALNLSEFGSLKFAMAFYGAPFLIDDETKLGCQELAVPSLSEVLLGALRKGRSSIEINTVLPFFIHKNRVALKFEDIVKEFPDKQYLGYLLDLLYRLTSDRVYMMTLVQLGVDPEKLRTRPLVKGQARTKFEKAYFERIENPAARAWRFLSGDSFENIRRRFTKWSSGDLHETTA